MAQQTDQQRAMEDAKQLAFSFFTVDAAAKAAKAAAAEESNIIDGLQNRLKESYKTAMDLRIQFQKQFGLATEQQGRDLVKRISDETAWLQKYEIRTEKLAENLRLVGQTLSTYVINRSDQSLVSFAKLISVNEKFGVETRTTANVINYLAGQFGLSEQKVESFNNKLLEFSRKTGQEFKQVFEDFSRSLTKFYTILDPEKAATQFMSFQQMARGFGTTVEQLMGVAAKFDDIQQGVDFGAQLNNVLSAVGGSFDSVFATTLDYDSRIKYVMKSIADTRGQIDQMSDVSQRAFIRQLQQSSQLSEQTIVSLLRNEKLVDNIENMSRGAGEFGKLKELAPGQQMAEAFTKFEDRANLFLNTWTQFGARAETLFSGQTKFMRDIQDQMLEPMRKATTTSKNLSDLSKVVTETALNAINLVKEMATTKQLPRNLDVIRTTQNAIFEDLIEQDLKRDAKIREGKTLPQYFAKNLKAGSKGQVIDLGDGLQVRHVEALEKLAKEMEAKRNETPKEYKTSLTLYGDDVFLAAVKAYKLGDGTKTNITPAAQSIGGP